MGNFNEISISDLVKLHEVSGMVFVVENGEIISAYIPAERMKRSKWKVLGR